MATATSPPYNAPKLLPAGGLERGGTDSASGVKGVSRLLGVWLIRW